MSSKIAFIAVYLIVCRLDAQSQNTDPWANGRPFGAIGLPNEATGFRSALPGIFDRSGHERRSVTGMIVANGMTTGFTFTRELDQRARLDLGTPARTIIANGLNTPTTNVIKANGNNSQGLDDEVMEVLADDTPEAVLFSFGTAARLHWLGANYRTDDGKSATYNGPLYDIFARTAKVATQAGTPERVKVFLFDSKTKLLAMTRYQIDRDGSSTQVEIAFGGWTSMSGQMVPTSITRSENGQVAFTITIQSATSSGTQADSLFGF